MAAITFHGQEYDYLSWESLGKDIFELAKLIQNSGKKFDRVIALAKGGLTFSRSLVDYLNIPEVSSIQIEFYTGVGSTNKTPVITQTLPTSIRDEEVLLFDDLVDQGETMKLAVEYLKYHGVKNITTCSFLSKPWSKFTPDFVVRETSAWIIFPNESRETIQLLKQMWGEKGDDMPTITQNLLKIGFPESEVEFFTQIL